MNSIVPSILTFSKLLQLENAPEPILVKFFGIVISVKLWHLLNELAPILYFPSYSSDTSNIVISDNFIQE